MNRKLPLKLITTCFFVMLVFAGNNILAQSVSATYTTGAISAQNNLGNTDWDMSCSSPTLNVTLPAGGPWQIDSIGVAYNITAGNGAWMSEQRSQLYCTNNSTWEIGSAPGDYFQGAGSLGGTFSYNRSVTNGFIIGSYFVGGASIGFQNRFWKTWSSFLGACDVANNQTLDSNTWVTTVYYSLASICLPPQNVSSAAITATSANLAWSNINTVAPLNYDVHWVLNGAPAPTSTTTPTNPAASTTTTFNLSSLPQNTMIDVYVRAHCSATDTSAWSAVHTFTTPPSCIAPTALNALNITATGADLDWTENNSSSNWHVYFGIAPLTPPTSTTAPTFQPTAKPYPIPATLPSNQNWEYYVRTDCGGDSSAWAGPYAFSTLPSCLAPSALAATNITATSADLSWTDNAVSAPMGWEVINQLTSGPVAGDTSYQAGALPTSTTLSTLAPNSNYEFYVRAVCGVGDSSAWVGPFNYSTPCLPLAPPTCEDFTVGAPVPSCWSSADSGDVNTGPLGLGNSAWVLDDFANGATDPCPKINLWIASKRDWLISPTYDLATAGGPFQMEMDFGIWGFSGSTPQNLGSDDSVQVLITNDGGVTWTALRTWTASSPLTAAAGDHIVESLTAYANDTVQFAIWASEGTVDDPADNDVMFDNFCVVPIPSCSAPSALAAANITATSADLSWTDNAANPPLGWEIINQLTSGPVAGDTTYQAGATPTAITMSTLTPNSNYEFYVRVVCGVGDTSTWVGPFSYSTPCLPLAPPTCEDFTVGAPVPGCWSTADNGDANTGPLALGNSAWALDNFANGAADPCPKINLWVASKRDWLISPTYDLATAGGPFQMEMDFGIWGFSGSTPQNLGSDDSVQVLITNDGGVTWTALRTWTASSPLTAVAGDHIVENLTAYANDTVQFAIWASEGTVDDPADNDVMFDNFCVAPIPSCLAPTAVTLSGLTSSTATLNWTNAAAAPPIGWQVINQLASGPMAGDTTYLAGATPTTITYNTLSGNTNYQFFVRAVCGVNDTSAWTAVLDYTTSITCGNTVYDNGGATGDYNSNTSDTLTICPSVAGDVVSLYFTAFNFEDRTSISVGDGCYDGITLYNGNSTSAPVISSPSNQGDRWCWDRNNATPAGSGDLQNANIISTAADGCLTLLVTSDGSINRPGFEAVVSCAPPAGPLTIVPQSAGLVTSDSLLIDGDGWFHYLNASATPTQIILSTRPGNSNAKVPNIGAVSTVTGAGAVNLSSAPYVTNVLGWHAMDRTWDVAAAIQPIGDVPIRFYYSTADYNDVLSAPNSTAASHTDLHMYKINNGKDELLVNGHTTVTSLDYQEYKGGAVTATDSSWVYSVYGSDHQAEYLVQEFSGGGGGGQFGNAGALPIDLISFTVTKEGNISWARWVTANEDHNSHFNLQRSLDGNSFTTLGKVNSKAPNGSSRETLNYDFTDNAPQIGHNYYRLEQVDQDGNNSYSEIIDVVWGINGGVISIYPNPVADKLHIDITAAQPSKTEVKLLDMSGRVIKSMRTESTQGLNHLVLQLNDVASGVYGVQVYENKKQVYIGKVRKN